MMQKEMVLKMLAEGRTVSKLTAVHLNIGNVNEVVRQLRIDGWEVETAYDVDARGKTFSKYTLSDYDTYLYTTGTCVA